MKLITIIIFLLFGNLSFTSFHPIHISVVTVNFNNSKNIYEVSIKLFTDDFEKAIEKNTGIKLNLGEINEYKDCNLLINRYIKNNIIFLARKKNIFKSSKLIKKEIKKEDNATWLYYEFNDFKAKKVSVRNSLMNDLYSDQKNLFIFTNKNTQEAFKFDKNKINFEFLIK